MITLITYMTGWLWVAALLGATLRFSIKDRLSTLGGFSTVMLVVAAPAFMFSTFLANRVLFQPSPRYTLSAIPIVIVLLASLVRGRTATIAISAYAAITTSVILGTLVLG